MHRRTPLTTAGLAVAASLALVPLTAAPAAATPVCDGDYVRTCVDLDASGYYYTASASIRDTDIGSDYDVAVSGLVVQINDRGRWEWFQTVSPDRDGFQDVVDRAGNGRSFCRGFDTATLRSKATMRWKRAGSSTVTTEVVTSRPITIACYA